MFNSKLIDTLLPVLLVILLSATSCNEGCNSQLTPNRQVKIGFKKEVVKNTFADTTVARVFIFNKDCTFFYTNATASRVSLELNQNSDSTFFYLKTDSLKSKITDTMLFSYKRELVLVSSECGFNTSFSSFKLINYTTNKIDSIIMVSEEISSGVPVNYNLVIKKDTTQR